MLIFLLSHDPIAHDHVKSRLQASAMLHVLGVYDAPDVVSALRRKLFETEIDVNDPCGWRGVVCWANLVTRIDYRNSALRDVPEVEAYEWIPPTLWHLHLAHQRINRPVDTQLLPRVLSYCSLRNCDIQGSFNVQTLPKHMETLDCSGNAISGAILLQKLPEAILSMHFSLNNISYVVVDNSALPPSLRTGVFLDMRCSVHFEEINGEVIDKRIRRGLKFFEEAAQLLSTKG